MNVKQVKSLLAKVASGGRQGEHWDLSNRQLRRTL